MIRVAALAFAVMASSALAQGVVSPLNQPSIDTSNLATKSDVQAASSAAGAAQSTATGAASAAAAAQAAIPPVCAIAPSGDTLNGTAGSTGQACTPPINNTRPTSVQAGNTTLAANCAFTVTFARAFTSPVPFVYAAVVDAAGNQMPCKTQTRSAAGFTGTCQGAQTTTLNLSIITAGLNLSPFGSTCTAGTPVMFVGREPTQ